MYAASSAVALGITPGSVKAVLNKVDRAKIVCNAAKIGNAGDTSFQR